MPAKYVEVRNVRTGTRSTMPADLFSKRYPDWFGVLDRLEHAEPGTTEYVGESPQRYAVRLVEPSALREPSPPQSYGTAAERFNKERELGRRVLEILREVADLDESTPFTAFRGACLDIKHAADALGLLGEEVPS